MRLNAIMQGDTHILKNYKIIIMLFLMINAKRIITLNKIIKTLI